MPGNTLRGTKRFLVACTLCATLAACGFQLRGVGNNLTVIPDDWKKMALSTPNPNGELSRDVVNRFTANGVEWIDRKDARYILNLSNERFTQRNLSLNSEARAAEFELTLSAEFSVRDDNGEVMQPTTASVVKTMENDPRNVTGKSEEIRLLRGEMRVELAQQILRRVGFFAASQEGDL